MKTYTVTGGGGLKLHVQETGRPNGKPILFIHGFSQCRLAWNKQLHSDPAQDFRLVAMDIRGHGLSEKPRNAYSDAQLWADDVQAVITTLGCVAHDGPAHRRTRQTRSIIHVPGCRARAILGSP